MMSKGKLHRLQAHSVDGHSVFNNPDIKLSQASRASQNEGPSSASTIAASQQYGSPIKKRRAARIPPHLLDQCTICMEEKLWSQAFSLLSSTLTAGFETDAPACIPPPQHLALAATIAVHPALTTRTTSADKHRAADDALQYLLNVMASMDVEDSGFKEAFRFESGNRSSRADQGTRKKRQSALDGENEEDPSRIRSLYADKWSLWTQAEDFWAIVGWAFNCSVRHKGRWRRWKVWLSFMLDVVEADLNSTTAKSLARKNVDTSQTLIARYMSNVGAGRNNKRQLMRAVTADGSEKSMAMFKEVWENETQLPKQPKEDRPAKRQKVDISNDEFGDYFNDSDDDVSEGKKVIRKRKSSQLTKAALDSKEEGDADASIWEGSGDAIEDYGGMDSIRLRQRFLRLFVSFSQIAPEAFVDTEELVSIFTEFIRPLPLEVFQQFVLPSKPYLSADMQACLNEMVSRPLLGSNSSQGLIDQKEFERTFATSTASNVTAVDNAKVSLLTESLLRALERHKLIVDLQRLASVVEEGIKLRDHKVAIDGRRKMGKKANADDNARATLRNSGARMMMLLSVAAKPSYRISLSQSQE